MRQSGSCDCMTATPDAVVDDHRNHEFTPFPLKGVPEKLEKGWCCALGRREPSNPPTRAYTDRRKIFRRVTWKS